MRGIGRWFGILVLGLSLGCTGSARRDHSRLAIALDSHRHLELEPCGCSLEDLGGVEREYNLLQKWKGSLDGAHPLVLATGATFVPYRDFDARKKSHYLTKAGFVVEAMNRLGVEALGVDSDDLSLGLDSLRDLEKRAKFNFLSANLADSKTGKAIFAPTHTLQVGGKSILLVGLTHGAASDYPLPKGIQVRDPRAGLRIAIQTSPKADVVMVLGSLPSKERQAMIQEFPEVQVWLGGGSDEESSYIANQATAGALYASSHQRGRGVMTVEFELTSPLRAFFNSKAEQIFSSFREEAKGALESAQSALAATKEPAARKAREVEVTAAQKRVESLNAYPRSASEGVSLYDSRAIPVNKSYTSPTNPLTELMREYKRTTKRLALDELSH